MSRKFKNNGRMTTCQTVELSPRTLLEQAEFNIQDEDRDEDEDLDEDEDEDRDADEDEDLDEDEDEDRDDDEAKTKTKTKTKTKRLMKHDQDQETDEARPNNTLSAHEREALRPRDQTSFPNLPLSHKRPFIPVVSKSLLDRADIGVR
jgi:hypothetical protein